MMEISLIRNGKTTWEYSSLPKKQSIKLYNVAVTGLAILNLDSLASGIINFNSDINFGLGNINNFVYWGVTAFIIGGLVLLSLKKSLEKCDYISVESILKELLWILVAIIPGILLILFGGGIL